MPLRGLTVVVATTDPLRFAGALRLAAAQAALGGRARLFLDEAAVPLLTRPVDDLLATALDLGVVLVACQSGLAAAGVTMVTLDARYEAGGLPSLLATIGDDRLVMV